MPPPLQTLGKQALIPTANRTMLGCMNLHHRLMTCDQLPLDEVVVLSHFIIEIVSWQPMS